MGEAAEVGAARPVLDRRHDVHRDAAGDAREAEEEREQDARPDREAAG